MKKQLLIFSLVLNSFLAQAVVIESLETLCAKKVLSCVAKKEVYCGVDDTNAPFFYHNGSPEKFKIPAPIVTKLSETALKNYMQVPEPRVAVAKAGDIFGFIGIDDLQEKYYMDIELSPGTWLRGLTLAEALSEPIDFSGLRCLIADPAFDHSGKALCWHAVESENPDFLKFFLKRIRNMGVRAGQRARIIALQVNDPLLRDIEVTVEGPTVTVGHGGYLTLQRTLEKATLTVAGGVPLHKALDTKQFALAKLLLQHGANPNIPDLDHKTPIHHAIAMRDAGALSLLLDFKANPDGHGIVTWFDSCPKLSSYTLRQSIIWHNEHALKTPLCYAIKNDDVACAALLLEHNAHTSLEVNAPSPIEVAAATGAVNVGKWLLGRMAHKTKEDFIKLCLIAAKGEHANFVSLLFEDTSFEQLTADDIKGLIHKCLQMPYSSLPVERDSVAKFLVKRSDKQQFLREAIAHRDSRLLEIVLSCGANVNLSSEGIASPLSQAIALVPAEQHIFNTLIDNGADPNLLDGQGLTPWAHLFIDRCSLEVARQILKHVPVNSICQGKTLLHWAVEYGRTDIARLLLENKVNAQVVDTRHYTPFQYALKKLNARCALLLLPHHLKAHRWGYLGALGAIISGCLVYWKLKH